MLLLLRQLWRLADFPPRLRFSYVFFLHIELILTMNLLPLYGCLLSLPFYLKTCDACGHRQSLLPLCQKYVDQGTSSLLNTMQPLGLHCELTWPENWSVLQCRSFLTRD